MTTDQENIGVESEESKRAMMRLMFGGPTKQIGEDRMDRIPMAILRPHEQQAVKNHGQTLEQLRQRGGISCEEALGIVQGWNPLKVVGDHLTEQFCYAKLEQIVNKHEAEQRLEVQTSKSMRRFFLNRLEDETGISGTGAVAIGVQFGDGEVVLHWPTGGATTGLYKSIQQLEAIHGHGGKTVVEWLD